MKGRSRRGLISLAGAMLGIGLFGHGAQAWNPFRGRKPSVDMPVSLATGTVTTPEFPVQRQNYLIIIRAQKRLPFDELNCMLGLIAEQPDPKCTSEPLLQANWTVRDNGQVVDHGLAYRRDDNGGWADESIDRILGNFGGQAKKRYVLEVNFVNDASALNVTNPRLIVMMTKPTDF